MTGLFLKIVNMSISASWLVLAVLLLRLVLKKAPKWVSVLLWGVVAVRLICPFSIESALSLIPSAETVSPGIMLSENPGIQSGVAAVNSAVNPVIEKAFAPTPGASANPLQILIPILSVVWAAGVAVLLLYTAVSYLRVRRRVDTAALYMDNIFRSENVGSPFVLGVVKPKIYLPYTLDGQELENVVAHERAHIRRRDHLWKPLGFLLLTVYWFNPLLWLSYVLLCRDIELACDESVIRKLDSDHRADYTQALLSCSVNRRVIAACPLAFGEVGVKERVKSVMNYKKPAFWLIVVSVIACAVLAVCFLTNPRDDRPKLEARIVEIRDGCYLVETEDGPGYIEVPLRNVASPPEPEAGDVIEITYDGTVLETNPARLSEVYRIKVIREAKDLTLDDVLRLSEKGYDLTWADLEPYRYYETGSGLYIRAYKIDDTFELWASGSYDPEPDSSPEYYVYLKAKSSDGQTSHIDIRDGGAAEFIAENEPVKYYLTVGEAGVMTIEYSMPGSSGGCIHADGSAFKKGEKVWLDWLDGREGLRGLTIRALDKNGGELWSATVPDLEERADFTHLTVNGWTITTDG